MSKVKITLGSRPKAFPINVSFPLHGGEEGFIPVLYRYRTKTEFGEFVDSLVSAANAALALKGEAPIAVEADQEATKFSLEQIHTRSRDQNVDYLMQALEGWGLDEEFSRENVKRFCDELPGGALAVMERYRLACTEGRLGN